MSSTPSNNQSAKIFISYRSEEPDRDLAFKFYEALKAAGHKTFMAGESLRLGDNWSGRIDEALAECDYFLLFLSTKSAASDMVTEEVKSAKVLRESRADHKPHILPIRIQFPMDSQLNYDLRGYLNRIHQRQWTSQDDTSQILQEVLSLVSAGVAPPPGPENSEADLLNERPDPLPAPLPVAEPEWPDGQVPVDSKYYVERPPIDKNCYERISKPGALIRIRAPRQMGKTSLMARVLNHVHKDCHTVQLSFQLTDGDKFTELGKLLRWFCASVGRKLQMPNRIKELWDDDMFGPKDNCTAYFEEYLLHEISRPLVLALDEVDRVFEYPLVTDEFFSLLRGWHEMAKNSETWQKLRLIVVHSTEPYVEMDVSQSPFDNVIFPANLPELTLDQVTDLARRHGIPWTDAESQSLTAEVSGHPFLIRVALYTIARKEQSLAEFLKAAPTEAGKYSDHLRRNLWILEKHNKLAVAYKRVVESNDAVRLTSEEAIKLEGMGLVKRQDDNVTPSRELYRTYFSRNLKVRNL